MVDRAGTSPWDETDLGSIVWDGAFNAGAPAEVSAAAGSVSSTVSGVEMAYAESATFVGSSSRRSLSCTSSTLKLPTPRARALWFSAGRRARETSAFQPSGSA